ncbi:hypothetical protein I307_00418 [Cryptococcus deuterogattii 99/473]|uniref:Unplaced genomic scaffold supercont1.4, whole genome shotgun sequence n=2 Tax=Cryptococcus deuterogattii TaxID=1859096 RepID=A0A0D0U133_9TREE|nr:hypothetical protein CNBG_2251 [Cryptococcus deuterogattii R265]KIR27571.1 hypothetical protein I309_03493 [Cryptococcus deuterogattii LA55]KIR41913.1 hypothetical protein I313_02074 [Cryptococcus deuterogattii Ram5]KIR73262.1 hypothetical protein I310_02927 [Cryptococcus deuterogattii CA1014]KIR91597.1 hypothetical protein I304_04420 [Cryptococcus deuterogattii CBS 10090]KIY59973.1 hypothetical protein I307_00418 [Cryptococcus deuterogattii 99/473]
MDIDKVSLSIEQRMDQKLRSSLEIHHLEFVDTSGNCGMSYAVTIVSPNFSKKITLQRHKLVNQILAEEIAQLHAFSQKTLTPEQWEKEKTK